MREILFRAKRIDNGEWIQGFYEKRHCALDNIKHLIFWSKSATVWEYAEIDPETLCQYTGLTDKNGNKIWENDIVDTDHYATKAHVVKYNYGSFYVGINGLLFHYNNVSKVIGNIFDNPELLKGGNNE